MMTWTISLITMTILVIVISKLKKENKQLKEDLEFKERQLNETETCWHGTIKDFNDLDKTYRSLKEEYIQQLDEVLHKKEKQQEQESFYATLNGSPAYLQRISFDLEDHLLAIIQNQDYNEYIVEQVQETAESALHQLTTLRSYMALSSKMFNSKLKVKENEQKTKQNYIRIAEATDPNGGEPTESRAVNQ